MTKKTSVILNILLIAMIVAMSFLTAWTIFGVIKNQSDFVCESDVLIETSSHQKDLIFKEDLEAKNSNQNNILKNIQNETVSQHMLTIVTDEFCNEFSINTETVNLTLDQDEDEFGNITYKKTYFKYEERKQLVEAIRYVDLVIPEDSWDQKRSDMHEYHIDTFVIGDDWKGKFDFLEEEGVEVVYLPRTPEISTTQIKKDLYGTNTAAKAAGEPLKESE